MSNWQERHSVFSDYCYCYSLSEVMVERDTLVECKGQLSLDTAPVTRTFLGYETCK